MLNKKPEIMNINKKTLITSVFGLSFILLSFNTRANEILEVKIDENTPVVRMKVNHPSANEIDFYLYNANDRMIFSERAELDESFESKVDFSGYRNGTYTLISEVGNMRLNKILEVKDSKVELIDRYYSFRPVILQEGDLLTVYFINNEGRDIGVSIENSSNTYYDAYYGGEDRTFHKVYNLENLSTGEYTFWFSANGEFFSHVFKVN